MERYDKEAVFDARVLPLIKKIFEICREEGIPMVTSFALACDGAGTHLFSTTAILPGGERTPAEYPDILDILAGYTGSLEAMQNFPMND
jgi:hypothetical protein